MDYWPRWIRAEHQSINVYDNSEDYLRSSSANTCDVMRCESSAEVELLQQQLYVNVLATPRITFTA